MLLHFDDRPSDSPFVERIWRSRSERAGTFHSIAMSHWEMVITKYDGKIFLTVRGLESKATPLHLSSMGAEWFGIRFKLGTVMPHLPASGLVGDFSLPTGRIATVTVPTLVIDGGEASWLSHAAQAVADVLPNAQRHTLKGQPHNVAPEAIAPVLIEFFNQ